MSYDRALYQMYLREVPMFASCRDDQLDHLVEIGEAVTAMEGTDIVTEGETGDGFYILASGTADVVRGGTTVASLTPGDYFGELSLFDPAPRNATVRATEAVSCVKLTRDSFTRALDEVPAIRDALLHGMAARIHELDRRI